MKPFNVEVNYYGYDCDDLPEECVNDCTRPGPADAAVEFWVEKLGFQAAIDGTKAYLSSMGAWEEEELQDHEVNLRRLLWTMAHDQLDNKEYSK